MTERTIDAAGTEMFVRDSGDGPPVLLLHGFPQTGRCWDRIAEGLASDHRVVAPDLPGYGRSARPPSYRARALGDVVAKLMDAVGAPRATVVGHDWGGAVAIRLALDHPDRVENLVVVNSPFRKMDFKRGWHMLFFNLPVLPEAAFTLGGNRLLPWAIRAGSARKDAVAPEAMAEYVAAYRTLERQRSAFAYYRTITRETLKRKLPLPGRTGGSPRRIAARTMVIWGERDPLLPPHLLGGFAGIPDIRIERLPDVGHFVPEEAPEETVAFLRSFLAPE